MASAAPPSDAVRFFERMQASALEAESAIGAGVDRWFEIAGLVVRLRFASEAMVDFACRALDHRTCDPISEPALTIHLWDSGSTGVAVPSRPESFDRFRGNGAIESTDGDSIRAAFVGGAEALSVFDPASATGVHWVRDADAIREYDKPAPLRLLLHWWLATHGTTLVHGAAVGGEAGGGALLAGPAGAGKSTTALACLAEGLGYLADDYCAVATDERPTAHSVYCSGKAVTADLWRLPTFTALVPEPDSHFEEKSIYYFAEHVPERLTASVELKAVIVPRVAGGETRVERASAAEALAALAPSTLFQLAHAGGEAFAALSQLVRTVPCYRLSLSERPDEGARAIRELLTAS